MFYIRLDTIKFFSICISLCINLLSANPTKWANKLKQFVDNFPTNCLNVFQHFVILAIKWLRLIVYLPYKERCLTGYSVNVNVELWIQTTAFPTCQTQVYFEKIICKYQGGFCKVILSALFYNIVRQMRKKWYQCLCFIFFIKGIL